MAILNNRIFLRHVKRFQATVSAIILTIVCCAVGQFPLPLAQAQTFSDPGFTSEVVTTLPQFLPVGSHGPLTGACSFGNETA